MSVQTIRNEHIGSRAELILSVSIPRLAKNHNAVREWVRKFDSTEPLSEAERLASIPGSEGLATLVVLETSDRDGFLSDLQPHEKSSLRQSIEAMGDAKDPSSPAAAVLRAYPDAGLVLADLDRDPVPSQPCIAHSVGHGAMEKATSGFSWAIGSGDPGFSTQEPRALQAAAQFLEAGGEDPSRLGHLAVELAKQWQRFERADEAREFLLQTLQAVRRAGSEAASGAILIQLGRLEQSRSNIRKAKQAFREAVEVFERLGEDRHRAVALEGIADLLMLTGELNEAWRILKQEVVPIFERLGDIRERAVALGKLADILFRRGELDEALRIRREEELPVYERLGDVRERAVTMGKVADILFRRGELDEALRIRREEELPAYERLGDVRRRAVALGRIAGILYQRGEYEEALRIHREEELPIYERIGDVYSGAIAQGNAANILSAQGELDEALHILQEEILPTFERLGDVRSRAVTLGKVADILLQRGELEEALRISREEELPVYERLGDVRERAVTLGRIAEILLSRGELAASIEHRREQLEIARRLGDMASVANALWSLARIDLVMGNTDTAIERLGKSFQINLKLGRTDGIGFVGRDLGSLLVASDHPKGREILAASRDSFRKIGLEEHARQVEELMQSVSGESSAIQEAGTG